MSEPEFESYLDALAQLLRLSRTQRSEIAAELRDHLEERLAALEAAGRSHDEACRLALAEFGDAAGLAQKLTVPHQLRRRRQVMRYSFVSATAIVVTFVMASFYWPAQRPEPEFQAVAQALGRAQAATPAAGASPDVSTTKADRELLRAKLMSRDLDVGFDDVPFVDALQIIGEKLDVDLVIDRQALVNVGSDLNAPVNLTLRKGAVTAKTALDLLLRQLTGSANSLEFVIRDGIFELTASEASYEVQVYNCRDLLEGVFVQGGGAQIGYVPAQFQVGPQSPAPASGISGTGIGPGGVGMTGGGDVGSATSPPGAALIHVIQQAMRPDEWNDVDGTGGTITEFNGLITVRHSQRTHERIEDLLTKLRTARGQHVGDQQAHVPMYGTMFSIPPASTPAPANSPAQFPGASTTIPVHGTTWGDAIVPRTGRPVAY